VVINRLNSWHHGDQRGFRSRGHRIHSSGDYKNRPPAGEHEGLKQYQSEISGEPIDISAALRACVGQTIVAALLGMNNRILAASVGDRHSHIVVEMPIDLPAVKRIFGQAKRKSSRSVKDRLPGSVWGAVGTYKWVKDREHLENAVDYVLYEQGDDAWTWSFRDGNHDGQFGRKRPHPRRR
jgi:REP element-mobilizing transposase RayT